MLTLPIPSNEALELSKKLFQSIRDEIIRSPVGSISFARFMEMALYAPGLGYYCAGSQKLGKSGDFITAPEISPLFSRCIARQCQQVLDIVEDGDILEIGAGTGKMACDLLLELERFNNLPRRYYILEISADLRARQKQMLATIVPHLYERVRWLNDLPKNFSGIIVANEVMDALPVTCFRMQNNEAKERRVSFKNKFFSWTVSAEDCSELCEKINLIESGNGKFADGYESEVNLLLPKWIEAIGGCLREGLVLLLDYGYGRREFYHPDRSRGTLMCHYQHHRHEDPFQLLGLQDITAHVDFTTIAESALNAECQVAGFTTQAAFLLACGLLDLAEEQELSPREEYQQTQAIKVFTMPAQMGELIKVIALTKKIDLRLIGFQMQDRRKDL
jgi:SAM-dependent MidA family methyltransferase